MPCFTVTLATKNTVYRLSEMISDQYDVDPGEPMVAESWREVNIQSSPDNLKADGSPIYIKAGCAELSGLRYGYQLAPGETKRYRLSSAFTSTSDKYFLCEEADDVQLSVELI